MGAAGEKPEFDIKPTLRGSNAIFSSRLSPKVFSTRGYVHIRAGILNQNFSVLG